MNEILVHLPFNLSTESIKQYHKNDLKLPKHNHLKFNLKISPNFYLPMPNLVPRKLDLFSALFLGEVSEIDNLGSVESMNAVDPIIKEKFEVIKVIGKG